MSEILDFKSIKKQQYEHRPITIKHSLLNTPKQEQYSLFIKVVSDRMFGKIGLTNDMRFSCELEVPMTGERESELASEIEKNLIDDMTNAVLERSK